MSIGVAGLWHPEMLSRQLLDRIYNDPSMTGFGISGMRERVRQCNGELIIHSNPPGTKITAIFPVKTGAANEQSAISGHGVA